MSLASPILILSTWVRRGLANLVNLRVSGRARVGWSAVDTHSPSHGLNPTPRLITRRVAATGRLASARRRAASGGPGGRRPGPERASDHHAIQAQRPVAQARSPSRTLATSQVAISRALAIEQQAVTVTLYYSIQYSTVLAELEALAEGRWHAPRPTVTTSSRCLRT
jgi:hypothetical protein